MAYVIKSPVEGYKGMSAGVEFVGGAGKTDDPRIAEWLERKGYSVSKLGKGKKKDAGPEPEEGNGELNA